MTRKLAVALASVALIAGLSACKTSGLALTSKGQVMHVDIDVPTDLSEGQTEELVVQVGNRGVNNIGNVVFQVEMPNELIVLSSVPSGGLDPSETVSPSGGRMYVYRARELHPTNSATVRYHVRAAFGSLDRSGDIKVTAWSDDLPGDKLVETKYVKLRS
ncbi:MAG: hypothetical protein ABI718_05530 [Acidobacteriota bacterium]